MLTRETAIIQAKSFVEACLQQGIPIEKAILFGSAAKNQLREYSDIDIALISSQFSSNFIKNNKLTSKINIKFPLIEVHHFNTNYYQNSDPLIDEINATGVVL
jgi:uncharacterized protein